jgi:hypothetical protein
MDCFFEYGLVYEVIDFEWVQAPKYRKPMVAICVYSYKYLEQLSENQIRRLALTHRIVWI